jgi:anti-sigma regulatory factor (Ser/Thr protein kinase)
VPEPIRLARAIPGIRGVRAHTRDDVTVLFATGPADAVVGELALAVAQALAEDPRAVVCDLSDIDGTPDANGLDALCGLGRWVLDWPGIPTFVVATGQLRSRLENLPGSGPLVLEPSLHEALGDATLAPEPVTATRSLPPHPTAARAARDFLTGCLLDWKAPKGLAAGSLVMSELVTNAMLYAHSDISVSLARHESLVRIAVRDGGRNIPAQRDSALESTHGRGLVIVEGFSRAWGVLPCSRGGKVVWAVIDA